MPQHWKRAIITAIHLALMGHDVIITDGSGWEVRFIRPIWGTSNGRSSRPMADGLRYLNELGGGMIMAWEAIVFDLDDGKSYRWPAETLEEGEVAA
jgi:hypothetical protein